MLSDAAHPSSIVLPVVAAASPGTPDPRSESPSAVAGAEDGTGATSGTDRMPATGAAVPLALAAAALAAGLLLRRLRAAPDVATPRTCERHPV